MNRFRLYILIVILVTLGLVVSARPTTHSARASSNSEQPYPISTSLPIDVRNFLRLETSLTMYRVLYQYGRLIGAQNGAFGPNITASRRAWFLEYQRAGATDVIAGVLRANRSLSDSGIRMFDFGFHRQAKNGSFPGSATPFHGTAMFLAEAGPALIVLRYSPMDSEYSAEIARLITHVKSAALYMVKSVGGPGGIDDRTKNHRWFEAALSLQSAEILTGDHRFSRWAAIYATKGIKMERANGVMPEDGGHDSGYQALGLTYAIRYMAMLPDGSLSHLLRGSIAVAEEWELSRVRPDGSVNQTGDTRTAGCKERDPAGQCKTVFYTPIFNALARWSIISRTSVFERAAYAVWLKNWAAQPGDVLPSPGLRVQPGTIRPQSWLTISGTRFQPLEVVAISIDGTTVEKIGCDQIGSFGGYSAAPNAHFQVPNLAPGSYEVVGHGSFGTVRRTHVTVTS